MNIFLGVPISAETLQTVIDCLIQEHPHWRNHQAIRWTPEDCGHLTLHFFGPIAPELLSGWIANLSDYLQSIFSFSIEINKLYNFPKVNSDLIAAYAPLSSPLAKLYQRVQQAVQDHRLPTESRPYFPHITICRAKQRHVLQMEPILLTDYHLPVSELILYQTQSTATGNRYVPLNHWLLPSERE